MKSSIFLVATAALLATATPLKKRVMVTDWVTEIEWVTLYDDGTSSSTPAANVEAPKATTPPAALANDNSVKPHSTSAAPSSSPPTPTPQPPKPQPIKPQPTKPQPQPVVVDVKIPEVVAPKVQPPVVDVKAQDDTPVVQAKPHTSKAPSPTKAPSPPKSSPPQQAPAGNNLDSYQKTVLDHHAILRKNHGVQPLEWDETLAQYAANTAKGCVFQHDMNQGSGNYGQNLASTGTSDDISGQEVKSIAQAITEQWYKGEINKFSFYGIAQPSMDSFHEWGHVTQLLWKDTRQVGCATVKCPAGTIFGMNSQYTVCNYGPPGNVQGQYGENVFPPLGLDISIV